MEGDVHLKEGEVDIGDEARIQLGGGESNNQLHLKKKEREDFIVIMQNLLLSHIDLSKLGVQMSNSKTEKVELEIQERTLATLSNVDIESIHLDPSTAQSPKSER